MKERTESIPEVDERNGWLRDIKWGAGTVWQSAVGSQVRLGSECEKQNDRYCDRGVRLRLKFPVLESK